MIGGIASSAAIPVGPAVRTSGNTSAVQDSSRSGAAAAEEARAAPQTGQRRDILASQTLETLIQSQEGENNPEQLSDEEQQIVQELQTTDRKVRAHEQAHKTVGGPYAGVVSFETVTGPDGRQYAVAGEVQIDASPVPGKPEQTIRKMDVVVRAALAPAQPSAQDYAVARAAQQVRLQAQQELNEKQTEERNTTSSNSAGNLGAAAKNGVVFSDAQTILGSIISQSA